MCVYKIITEDALSYNYNMNDSIEYIKRREFFDSTITLYGRKVVDEVLDDKSVQIYALHLSKSNRDNAPFELKAKNRNIEIKYHTKVALSRISKNAKQDQGVAIDVIPKSYCSVEKLIDADVVKGRLIALEGINNPQNLGLIIRSCAASDIDAIVLGGSNRTKISPLVMKASAGTLFKIPIYYCDNLHKSLKKLQKRGWSIVTLSLGATDSLFDEKQKGSIFVLGNESCGVSKEIEALSDRSVSIPMKRGVESLNVAVAAALVAFAPEFR